MGRQKRPERNGRNRDVRKNAFYSRLSGTHLGTTVAPSRASERVTCRGHGGSRRRRPSSPTSDKDPWPPPPCPLQPSSQRALRPALTYGDAAGRRGSEAAHAPQLEAGIGERAPGRLAALGSAHAQSAVTLARFGFGAAGSPLGSVRSLRSGQVAIAGLEAERNPSKALSLETLCLIHLRTLGSGGIKAKLDALQVALTLEVFLHFYF